MPFGTFLGDNHGSTLTSYTGVPTRGRSLPNMVFPYGGDYQGQNIQGVNMNPLVYPILF